MGLFRNIGGIVDAGVNKRNKRKAKEIARAFLDQASAKITSGKGSYSYKNFIAEAAGLNLHTMPEVIAYGEIVREADNKKLDAQEQEFYKQLQGGTPGAEVPGALGMGTTTTGQSQLDQQGQQQAEPVSGPLGPQESIPFTGAANPPSEPILGPGGVQPEVPLTGAADLPPALGLGTQAPFEPISVPEGQPVTGGPLSPPQEQPVQTDAQGKPLTPWEIQQARLKLSPEMRARIDASGALEQYGTQYQAQRDVGGRGLLQEFAKDFEGTMGEFEAEARQLPAYKTGEVTNDMIKDFARSYMTQKDKENQEFKRLKLAYTNRWKELKSNESDWYKRAVISLKRQAQELNEAKDDLARNTARQKILGTEIGVKTDLVKAEMELKELQNPERGKDYDHQAVAIKDLEVQNLKTHLKSINDLLVGSLRPNTASDFKTGERTDINPTPGTLEPGVPPQVTTRTTTQGSETQTMDTQGGGTPQPTPQPTPQKTPQQVTDERFPPTKKTVRQQLELDKRKFADFKRKNADNPKLIKKYKAHLLTKFKKGYPDKPEAFSKYTKYIES